MRRALAMVLGVAGTAGIGVALYQHGEYAAGAAERTRASWDAVHSTAQIENDRLDLRNEELAAEIDRRQHRRNDGKALGAARVQLLHDEEADAKAQDRGRAIREEDIPTEWVEGGGGAVCLITGLVLAAMGPRRRPAAGVQQA